MKKKLLQISFLLGTFLAQAQLNVSDFETFSLGSNSFYKDTNSAPFSTYSAQFEHKWNKMFSYWSGGFSYTNKYDSATAGASNLYGVRAFKGYNNSNLYAVGQDRAVIAMASSQNTVDGFYITNTTYAYKSMKHGDAFAKKFGGLSGNDPDYFKITIKAYDNGVLKQDSVEFYLADYRFANNSLDYLVENWQWVSTATLGEADSIRFFMYSSDVGSFGINTPLFFGLDNFTTNGAIVSIAESKTVHGVEVYPNPFQSQIKVILRDANQPVEVKVLDMFGKLLYTHLSTTPEFEFELSVLPAGVYYLSIQQNNQLVTKRVVKL